MCVTLTGRPAPTGNEGVVEPQPGVVQTAETSTVQVSVCPSLVRVTNLVPPDENAVLKLAPVPLHGEQPPEVDHENVPLPPDATKSVTVSPVLAGWLEGEQTGGGPAAEMTL